MISRAPSERALRARCRRLLRGLDIRLPLDPLALCARFAEVRGRPLEVVGRPIPAGAPSGFLVSFEHKDLIVHQSATTPSHQTHIVFHEFAHLAWGHLEAGAGTPLVCGSLFPPGQSDAQDGSPYAEPAEWEAEVSATILSSWTASARRAVRTDDATEPVARRLGRGLGETWEWS